MKKTLIASLITLHFAPAWAETLAPVDVSDTALSLQELVPASLLLETSARDTGTLLRQLNGVDGSRMGGHGIDPVIHGQKEGRVRIVLDGAEIASGCPNRMDPATVYADLETYETVGLSTGIATLTEPVENAAAGTISLIRKLPTRQGVHGTVSAAKSNLIDYGFNADISAASEKGALRVFDNRTEGQNYQDGNGDTVKARYSHLGYGVLSGYRPDEKSLLTFSAERSRTEDALYPGAKMDSPYTEGNILRLGYSRTHIAPWLDKLEARVYRSTVDHLMDNYSLRDNTGKKMRTPTDTETTGGSLKLASTVNDTRLRYGLDHRAENKYAEGQMVMGTTAYVKAYLWPDTWTTRTGVFAEAERNVGINTFTAGVRYDLMDYDARKADADPDGTGPAITARQLYNATYKTPADIRQSEGNASLLLRWQRPLGAWRMAASLSHTPRVPDATERYMAKASKDATTQTDQSWVGNPNLNTEYHNQINLTLKGDALKGHWQVSVWSDWVNDYILKDWARNQPDAVNPVAAGWQDKRIIYVNKDAQLQGIDLSANWALGSATDLNINTAWVQGHNDTDNRNLAGIPPLSGQIALNHQRGAVLYGARINWATDKTDIDPQGAPDETGKVPGWATLDLYADWRLNRHWHVSAGVDNVFDHAYANYLNRRMDPTQGNSYLVNEPGRSIYAKVTAKF